MGRNLCCLVVGIFALACYSRANAAATIVYVYFDGVSADPVNITAGDVVYWEDGDEFGPYNINGAWGSFATPGGIQFNAAGTYSYSVSSDSFGLIANGTVNVSAPTPLNVTISDPTNNSVFFAPATFNVTAQPAGGATPYSDVEFFVGTNYAGDITSSPFTTTVTNLPVGNYTISAVVTDGSLNTATNSIQVSVVAPPSLTAKRAGNQILVSWPTNNPTAVSLSLQTATNLGAAASWTPVTQTPAPIGNQWVVTNSISPGPQFFRLSSQ